MRTPTRRHMLACLPLMAQGAIPSAALATPAYPERAVTLVAPFSAGGAADIAARTLAAHAGRHLPNRAAKIVVENRPGASGAIGTQHVARAIPDGHTLLLARVASAAILPATDERTPYRWDGFTMLGLLDENPFVLAVRGDAPWQTLQDLLVVLREQPATLRFATTGPATILDLGVRHMFAVAGLPIDAAVAVPFRGGGEAVAALVRGEANFIGNNLSDTIGAIASGQLRALAVATEERLPSLRGVPTVLEAGLEGLREISGWNALFGPPGLPAPVVEAWTGVIGALAEDRGWQAATRRVGSLPRLLGPVETHAFVGAQVALYHDIGRRLGIVT